MSMFGFGTGNKHPVLRMPHAPAPSLPRGRPRGPMPALSLAAILGYILVTCSVAAVVAGAAMLLIPYNTLRGAVLLAFRPSVTPSSTVQAKTATVVVAAETLAPSPTGTPLSPTETATLSRTPTPFLAAATPMTRPTRWTSTPTATRTPTVTPTPTVPPGLYVTDLLTQPSPAKRGQNTAFYATFLNATGVVVKLRWVVFIFKPDNSRNAFGQSTALFGEIPVGQSQIKSVDNWKLNIVTVCEDYVARVAWYDGDNRMSYFTAPGGWTFEKPFQVCP